MRARGVLIARIFEPYLLSFQFSKLLLIFVGNGCAVFSAVITCSVRLLSIAHLSKLETKEYIFRKIQLLELQHNYLSYCILLLVEHQPEEITS